MELLHLTANTLALSLMFVTIFVLLTASFSAPIKKFFNSLGYWWLLLALNIANAFNAGLDLSTGQGQPWDWIALVLSLSMFVAIAFYLYHKRSSAEPPTE